MDFPDLDAVPVEVAFLGLVGRLEPALRTPGAAVVAAAAPGELHARDADVHERER